MRVIMTVVALIFVSNYAHAKTCAVAKITQDGTQVMSILGDIDPKSEDVKTYTVEGNVTAACLGLGAEDPGIACGFVVMGPNANLRDIKVGFSRSEKMKDVKILALANANEDFGDLGVRWTNPTSQVEYFAACLKQ